MGRPKTKNRIADSPEDLIATPVELPEKEVRHYRLTATTGRILMGFVHTYAAGTRYNDKDHNIQELIADGFPLEEI